MPERVREREAIYRPEPFCVADPTAEEPRVDVGLSDACTVPRVLVSPSVMALPALSPGIPSGTVPAVVLLGAKFESPESACSEGPQPVAAHARNKDRYNLDMTVSLEMLVTPNKLGWQFRQ